MHSSQITVAKQYKSQEWEHPASTFPLTRSLLTQSRHRKSTIQRTHAKDWRLPQCAVPHIRLTPLQLSGRCRTSDSSDSTCGSKIGPTELPQVTLLACELLRRTGHEIGTKLRLLINLPNTFTLHTIHLQYTTPEDTTNHLHARTYTLSPSHKHKHKHSTC